MAVPTDFVLTQYSEPVSSSSEDEEDHSAEDEDSDEDEDVKVDPKLKMMFEDTFGATSGAGGKMEHGGGFVVGEKEPVGSRESEIGAGGADEGEKKFDKVVEKALSYVRTAGNEANKTGTKKKKASDKKKKEKVDRLDLLAGFVLRGVYRYAGRRIVSAKRLSDVCDSVLTFHQTQVQDKKVDPPTSFSGGGAASSSAAVLPKTPKPPLKRPSSSNPASSDAADAIEKIRDLMISHQNDPTKTSSNRLPMKYWRKLYAEDELKAGWNAVAERYMFEEAQRFLSCLKKLYKMGSGTNTDSVYDLYIEWTRGCGEEPKTKQEFLFPALQEVSIRKRPEGIPEGFWVKNALQAACSEIDGCAGFAVLGTLEENTNRAVGRNSFLGSVLNNSTSCSFDRRTMTENKI